MLQRFKVLICDDSLLVRKKLRESLEQCGSFEILEAADGETAVEVYREHRPALVFMDIVMPVRDGVESLTEIKKIDDRARVVMLSSSGTQSHLKKAIQAGAVDFIQKPWEHSQIVAVVARAVKESEGHHV